jgi:hypothetical protein
MAKLSIEKYKSFEKWKIQEVENEFGLNQLFKLPLLSDLVKHETIFTEKETIEIEELKELLLRMVVSWNEYDMSIMFIGPLFRLLDMQNKKYRTFFNHYLTLEINGKEIAGRVDGMLAKGWQIPEKPLFFMQEYKSESGPNGDPLGQLLIEMVAAQAVNNDPDQALYGCYIIGRNWFFVVLQEKNYAVSNAYVATDIAIFDIVGILKKIKKMFELKIGYVAD